MKTVIHALAEENVTNQTKIVANQFVINEENAVVMVIKMVLVAILADQTSIAVLMTLLKISTSSNGVSI